jgi:hypothetical protein
MQSERDILFLTLKWSAFIADKSTQALPASPFPSKPSATSSMAWKKSALEFDSGGFRARNFRISRLSLPASKAISNLAFACARNDSALPPTQLFFGLFS